jgi:hypothetical protein
MTGAYHIQGTCFTPESVMHVSLRSITRGRARGPPTALSQHFGLGRRFLGNARFLDGPTRVVGDQGAARLTGTNISVASGGELSTSAAAWLHV